MLSSQESQSKSQLAAENYAVKQHPVEYWTENGFSIIRRCDLDESITVVGIKHSFVVRDPHGYELEITVGLSYAAVAEIISRSSGRLSLDSSYWICCAERHLADYLWENDDYPPEARLRLEAPTLDDINLAQRWGTNQERH
jgi:hypothetical protein